MVSNINIILIVVLLISTNKNIMNYRAKKKHNRPKIKLCIFLTPVLEMKSKNAAVGQFFFGLALKSPLGKALFCPLPMITPL